MAPSMARTRGGSDPATSSSRANRPLSRDNARVRRAVSPGESSLVLPARRRKSSSAASVSRRPVQASGLLVWMIVSLPRSFLGRVKPAGRHFGPPRRLGRESKQVRGRDSGGKDRLARGSQVPHSGGVRQALAKCGLPGAVVDAFAHPFQLTLQRQPGQSLRHRGNRRAGEVLVPPQAFPASCNALADSSLRPVSVPRLTIDP